jgi:hypothetical protein
MKKISTTVLEIEDIKKIADLNGIGKIELLDNIGCREAYYSSIKQRKGVDTLTKKLSDRIMSYCEVNGLKTQI